MSKLLSLYGRTVTLVTIVFIVSFSVLSLAFMSLSASEERDRVRDLERNILLANSHVRDFIITKDPTHAKETELILQQADKLVEEGIRTENYQRLHNEVLMYLHSINNLIVIFQEQGFYEDDGLEGSLRQLSSRMEQQLRDAGETRALVSLLEVSRHEKEFLLSRREESVTGLHASIDDFMGSIKNSNMSRERTASLFKDITEFQDSFDKLVSLEERLEWTRDQLSYFRSAIGGTLQEVTALEQVRAKRFLWSALGLILFAFMFGIVYAIRIARSVLVPLEHLRKAVKRVASGEEVETFGIENAGDLTELMASFEEVTRQVKLRKEAEKDLKSSKEDIQKYANELESQAKQLDLAIEKLGVSKREAEVASKRKAEFLASMSHEIRTPLNGIIGMTSLFSVDDLKADQKEIVDVIRTSGESLLGIVNHILDFSKIEAGGVTLESEEFNLTDCIEDALSMVSRQAAEKGIDLSSIVEQGTPLKIVGDLSRLRQVLVNLLGNAVKFTPHGEIQIKVSCLEQSEDRVHLQIQVQDSGIGIAPEKLNSLFNPFIQAELSTNRKFGGTGLGLSISQGLVQLMGGTMQVESEVGKGSLFSFDISVELGERHKHEVAPKYAGQRILLLNEAPLFGEALSHTLKLHGFEIEETQCDEEAISRLQEGRFFAVFINEGKNGFDGVAGVAVAGMLCDASPSTPIVVLRHINQQVLSGSTRCLLKPVKRASLDETLLLLENRHGRQVAKKKGENASLPNPTLRKVEDRPPQRDNSPYILLVEDNLVNQKVGVRMLEKLGYDVDVVDRGDKAIASVQTGKYSVVFMDVQMPGMDGLEATTRIRELGDIVQPAIIALTANATTEDRSKCLKSGMDDYASKPVNPQTLDLLINQWTSTSRPARPSAV